MTIHHSVSTPDQASKRTYSAPRSCTPAEYEEKAEVRNEPNEATIQNEGGKFRYVESGLKEDKKKFSPKDVKKI